MCIQYLHSYQTLPVLKYAASKLSKRVSTEYDKKKVMFDMLSTFNLLGDSKRFLEESLIALGVEKLCYVLHVLYEKIIFLDSFKVLISISNNNSTQLLIDFKLLSCTVSDKCQLLLHPTQNWHFVILLPSLSKVLL